jgi:hypothetical protein
MLIGFVVYFSYSRRNSKLNGGDPELAGTPALDVAK